MSNRFSYVKYDDHSTKMQEDFKKMFQMIETYANEHLSPARYVSLLMTSLEEAYAWSGKAIRDEQIERDGKINHLPERSNS